MHILTVGNSVKNPIQIYGGYLLHPGKSYIGTNTFCGMMMCVRDLTDIEGAQWPLNQYLASVPYREKRFNETEDWNGRTIWLLRGGGFGDLLMITPIIKELKKRWPDCKIKMAHSSRYNGIFSDLPVESVPELVEPHEIGETDCFIPFEEWIEGNPNAKKKHMAHVFAEKLGITLSDITPYYKITDEEMAFANEKYPRSEVRRIGVQFVASCVARSYPHIGKVIDDLSKMGVEVFIFGVEGQLDLPYDAAKNITNLSADKLTFRQSAAVLKTCDSLIAPDSALPHLASAIKVPCVALYGPFPGELRVTGELTKIMQGTGECAPCFHHARQWGELPIGKPCSKEGYCTVLGSIPPEMITANAIKICYRIIQIPGKNPSGLIIAG